MLYKLVDLASLFSVTTPNVLAITETFLDSSVLDVELVPSNCVVFRSDRNCHGGGMMVAVIDLRTSHYTTL